MKQSIKDIFTSSGTVFTYVVIPEGDKEAEKLRASGEKLAGEWYCKFEESAYKNKKGECKVRFTYKWSKKFKKHINITIEKWKIMKYKVGDKVKIKSKEWYDKNKDEDGDVELIDEVFKLKMIDYLGKCAVVKKCLETYYEINIDSGFWNWTDEMFEDENE